MTKFPKVKTILTAAILFFGLFGMAKVSLAATNHFVRAGATGSANGNDWTNAYTNLPSSLVRGDTYYVAGGSYGSRTFSDSGTAVITIKGATAADHGTDTGWSSGYGVDITPAAWTGWVFSASYYYIDGQVGGGPTNWSAGLGFNVIGAGGNYRILFNSGTSNITVRHTEISNTDTSNYDTQVMAMSNVTYVTFSYCYIHHSYGCQFQTAYPGTHDWIIEYSKVGDNTGTTANHSEIWSRTGSDNFTWRWNYIYSWRSTGIAYATGPGTNQNGTGDSNISNNIYFYGNIFDQAGTTANWGLAAYNDGSYDYQYASGWLIANNTFINLNCGSGCDWIYTIFLGTNGSYNPNLVYNNIFYGNADGMEIHATSIDYNSYQGDGQWFTGSHNSTLSSSPFVNYSGANYQLSGHLAGTTLPSPYNVAPFNQDMLGHTFGADSVWDKGAYAYGTGSSDTTPPAAPTGLTVN